MKPNEIISRLALEDGTIYEGRAFGATHDADGQPITVVAEVVFNTAMSGYQEALTDPSYSGQILLMTTPMIGNYGVNTRDIESASVRVSAFVVREATTPRAHHRATDDLSNWLKHAGIPALQGIDTRALTRRLRVHGVMRAALSTDDRLSDAQLVEQARTAAPMAGQNLVTSVSGQARTPSPDDEDIVCDTVGTGQFRVVALDCGAKQNILRHLVRRGCEVVLVGADSDPAAIRDLKPDGLFISNGPGDPSVVKQTIATLRDLAGEVPTFGICLGHQLLCLALGAKTYKLPFGHRGANQPVKNVLTGRVEITSQNHGFAVDAESIARIDCEVTHIHLNDQTIAGFRHRSKPILAVQYHPEAAPGPHDAQYLFDCFIEMMKTGQPITADQMQSAWEASALAIVR